MANTSSKIVLIPASLHKNSLNKKLLEVCAEIIKKNNSESVMISQSDLNVPLINTDDPALFPASMKSLSDKINAADAVLIGAPEYNAGISPVLKNLIDWTSTLRPHPWKGKSVLLVGSSPGDFGAISGLAHSRIPLDRLGAVVWPQPYALPRGNSVIEGTKLNDETRQKNLEATIEAFLKSL